ncbi:MAG TPA: uroporphyrinogen decarboxylase family protein [bacterium]|nr:uroporphyrinogen decarboxylase family protein [bacterium]
MTDGQGTMGRCERIRAALRREPTDRPAISLWRHFPGQDGTPRGLADATVAFQRAYDVDLVKLMPTGMYAVMDYGVRVAPSGDAIGTTRFDSGPIRATEDWGRLPSVSASTGTLGAQVETVRLVRAALGAGTPVVQTIFSPLTMAVKLAGAADAVVRAAEERPQILRGALARMADDVVAFGRACLDAGANGFFFATQLAAASALPEGMYRRFGVPFDLQVLGALRAGAWCTILHLHGLDPMFELADEYPIDAVNWHDRETSPSLAEAMSLTTRALVGGIARRRAIASGQPDQAAAEVRDAIRQTNGRVIVAPGCVIPYQAAHENLLAARRAVDPTRPT